MTEAVEVARRYFELSNASNLDGIAALFAKPATYSSATTGMYLGRQDIIIMQKRFHARFSSVHWQIDALQETKPGIVRVEYTFVGQQTGKVDVQSSGVEYVIVHQGKIHHVEIRPA